MRESTDRQLLEVSKAKGKKVLDLVCAPRPDAAEENTKQIGGVISARGLRRIVLAKTAGDAWERMPGEHYRNTVRKGFVGRLSWKPTKLLNTDQTTASTIHQLRLGHGYFRAFLARLPSYNSTQCQCLERVQGMKHLLLGCRTYQNEREIGRAHV